MLGTGTIVNGVATLTTTALPVGTNITVGAYPGNGNYTAATSAPTTITITQATPVLAAPVAAPASAAFGTSVVLTQSVPSGATGTIVFSSGSTVLGTATLSGGAAVLTTTSLPVGTNPITGAYGGNTNYTAAISPASTIVVTPAVPTLSAPTASPASASYGSAVTLTQTVPPGVTGTITFLSGSTVLGAATIVNGVATLTTTSLPPGTNMVAGVYSGNGNYSSATSPSVTVTIAASATCVALSASPLTAAVSSNGTAVGPTTAGISVQFLDGTASLGSALLSQNDVATLISANLAVGSHTITATFAGSGIYPAGSSAAVALTITQITATLPSPVASPTSGVYGASITLTQNMPAGATGTVSFMAGNIVLGTATIVNGAAALTTTPSPPGPSP